MSGRYPGCKSQSWFPDLICPISNSAALGFLSPNKEGWGWRVGWGMMKSECVQEKKKKGKEERDCKQFNALF